MNFFEDAPNITSSILSTIDDFRENMKNIDSSSNLKIINYNIRSFFKHIDDFICILDSCTYDPDVIVLTETWLTNENSDFAKIEGYKVIHTVRKNAHSGGVSIFYKNFLNVDKLDELTINDASIETCTVKLRIKDTIYYFIGIYRPNTGTVFDFLQSLDQIFHKIRDLNKAKVIILGDFNINLMLSSCNNVTTLSNSMRSYFFLPIITDVTRYPANEISQPSLLDHVWFNFVNCKCQSTILLTDQTDHNPVVINIEINSIINNMIRISFRDQSKKCVDYFRRCLNCIQWDVQNDSDIEEKLIFLTKTIDDLYQKCFPLKSKMINTINLNKPWITPAIRNSIRTKSNYFKLYKRGIISRERNNEYKNLLYKIIRAAKRSYFFRYFESSMNNVKKSWDGIKSLMGNSGVKKGKSKIDRILVNGELITDELIIAKAFNNYFSNIAKTLDNDIPELDSDENDNLIVHNHSFYMFPVSKNECENIIASLNNTNYGQNSIPTKILKKVKDIISYPLSKLINCSFQAGIFPNKLKIGKITPIFKNDNPQILSNYRPINVLPLYSKIFEKCMSNRLTKFLSKFSLLSPNQFGFQKGLSCFDAISSLVEYLYKQINENKHVLSVFIDLKKAYDTVNHKILLAKLKSYGVRGIALDWFTSYLENRFQCVRVGNSESEYEPSTIGVPQGSVLGGLLFLIYINDLPNVSDKLFTVLYADDTCMSLSNQNYDKLVEDFNFELNKINKWLIKNRLSLNTAKTVTINFSKRANFSPSISLKMNDVNLIHSNDVKYLGVLIDKNLNFKPHVEKVCAKVSRTLGVLYRISINTPELILVKLYYALVYPYLTYCNIIWGGASACHLNKIMLLQKRAVRIITSSNYLEHSTPLFFKLRILKIVDIYKYLCCMFAHKNLDKYDSVSNIYSTRNSNNLIIEYQRLNITQRSIKYIIPKFYNDIPTTIKSLTGIGPFKRGLQNFILETYVDS